MSARYSINVHLEAYDSKKTRISDRRSLYISSTSQGRGL